MDLIRGFPVPAATAPQAQRAITTGYSICMKVQKLFQRTLFGIFLLFGVIGLSASVLVVYTVDTHLSQEYQSNGANIAKTIADSSVDILLNRDLAALQSLIDQFVEIQGIKYVYIANEAGEFVAHTFVPGIPAEIRDSDPNDISVVERNLVGMGDFVEVASPILAGEAGSVHVGMDTGLVALKVQHAIGQQVYLISIIFIGGVFAAIWLVNLAAKPLGRLLAYSVDLARRAGAEEDAADREISEPDRERLLARQDEVGQLARLFLYLADIAEAKQPPATSRLAEPMP